MFSQRIKTYCILLQLLGTLYLIYDFRFYNLNVSVIRVGAHYLLYKRDLNSLKKRMEKQDTSKDYYF